MTRKNHDANFRFVSRSALALAMASLLTIAISPVVSAQDASPEPSFADEGATVVIESPGEEGVENVVGTATFIEEDGAVTISVQVENLPPGDHGIHIHEFGICDPDADPQYSTAGGHYNPTGATHGPGPQTATPGADVEAHAGDLGNITVGEDGTGTLEVTTDRVSLDPDAENTLFDDDGSALVIHENPDDLQTDPSGESGARIACGVIYAGLDATPVPIASPATGG